MHPRQLQWQDLTTRSLAEALLIELPNKGSMHTLWSDLKWPCTQLLRYYIAHCIVCQCLESETIIMHLVGRTSDVSTWFQKQCLLFMVHFSLPFFLNNMLTLTLMHGQCLVPAHFKWSFAHIDITSYLLITTHVSMRF